VKYEILEETTSDNDIVILKDNLDDFGGGINDEDYEVKCGVWEFCTAKYEFRAAVVRGKKIIMIYCNYSSRLDLSVL